MGDFCNSVPGMQLRLWVFDELNNRISHRIEGCDLSRIRMACDLSRIVDGIGANLNNAASMNLLNFYYYLRPIREIAKRNAKPDELQSLTLELYDQIYLELERRFGPFNDQTGSAKQVTTLANLIWSMQGHIKDITSNPDPVSRAKEILGNDTYPAIKETLQIILRNEHNINVDIDLT
jgi:hypothetical protein